MEDEELEEGDALLEGNAPGPVVEAQARTIVPKQGKLIQTINLPSGKTVEAMKAAVIRPCMSRGRKIKGFSPIYEAAMLARDANVFTNWPMYMDHISEAQRDEIAEMLAEAGRPITDLGGRIVESWFDPELTFEDDEEYGFRRGGIVAAVIPQPAPKAMLEADPEILHLSINAYPKGVKLGTPSWAPGDKGAVIEGISPKPMGSVDWVFRGGAGGRPLAEADRKLTVSVLESVYDSSREREEPPEGNKSKDSKVKKLSEMKQAEIDALTLEQLKECLKESNPTLAEAIITDAPATAPAVPATGGLTMEQLTEALDQRDEKLIEQIDSKLEENDPSKLIEEHNGLRDLADTAKLLISEAAKNVGLDEMWEREIAKNYILLPSGATPGLLVEAETDESGSTTKTVEQVLEERVRADVNHALKLYAAAGGKPRVAQLGPSDPDPDGTSAVMTEESADKLLTGPVGEFLRENNDIPSDPKEAREKLSTLTGAEA